MAHQRISDPAQVDRFWFGYHPRALAPTIVAVAIVSIVTWTGRWYLDHLSELANRLGALALFAVAWGPWPVLVTVFLYRTVTYSYRLTDRALVVDFGFWHRPVPPVLLADITSVRNGPTLLGSALSVGWIEIQTIGGNIRLVGVYRPHEIAERIRTAVTTSRAKTGTNETPPPGK